MQRLRRVARFWFTFEAPVSRGAYLRHGLTLMVLKYVVDATLIWSVLHLVWTPWDYLATGAAFATSNLRFAPASLLSILALWTLPFIWIGLTMSIRRALDAGRSAWLALLFFVPVVNYGVMLLFCLLPTAPTHHAIEKPRPQEAKLPSALLAIAAGLAAGLAIIVVSIYALRSYGVSLFLGVPFMVGALTAYLFNRRYPASRRETMAVVTLTLAAIGGTLLLFALEGAVCLIMALPLALGIAALGALIGRGIALRDDRSPAPTLIALVLIAPAAPLLAPSGPSTLHEVRSVIEIAAPPERVWSEVIAFPALPQPSRLVVRSGIAYPVRAHIVGSGIGAVRYCEFSTGAFVEPITRWEPGHRLGFDVVAQPAPMREWSLYANVSPPHLDGYFRARRGEFRLERLPNDHTRLEGTTWYELRIEPVAYWSVLADWIVGRIHERVLNHIMKSVSARTP